MPWCTQAPTRGPGPGGRGSLLETNFGEGDATKQKSVKRSAFLGGLRIFLCFLLFEGAGFIENRGGGVWLSEEEEEVVGRTGGWGVCGDGGLNLFGGMPGMGSFSLKLFFVTVGKLAWSFTYG